MNLEKEYILHTYQDQLENLVEDPGRPGLGVWV